MDQNFSNQWEQAERFLRAPYMVYNPWVDGRTNYEWMEAHLPAGLKLVAADIEVRKWDYEPEPYAQEVKVFIDLAKQKHRMVIYTGGWFLPILAYWPTNVEYWFARYPNAFYPDQKTWTTWEVLNEQLDAYPWCPGAAPGIIRMWQISGDRLILPGTCGRPVDVNLFNGTLDQAKDWFGVKPPPLLRRIFLPFVTK